MNSVIDSAIVLKLNRLWQPIGHRTVKDAIGDVASGANLAMDLAYEPSEMPGEKWDFDKLAYANPITWEEWIKLPIRDYDLVVHSVKGAFRVPTVIVAHNFDRMPEKKAVLSRRAVFERDSGVCQYTGQKVGWSGGNLDHVVPRARGGKDTFENLVWASRAVNSAKEDRLPHEAGLTLRRVPRHPRSLPVSATIREPRHPSWRHFLIHR